jgi:hypothetical protein
MSSLTGKKIIADAGMFLGYFNIFKTVIIVNIFFSSKGYGVAGGNLSISKLIF